jgi:hypothetical protein
LAPIRHFPKFSDVNSQSEYMHNLINRFTVHFAGGLALAAATASAEVKLYWTATDGTGAYVVRANADGSSPANLVSGAANVLGPNGLETANGLLYWPDQQLNAIMQANPDGTGVTTFATASNPYDVFGTTTQVFWTSLTGNYVDTQLTNGSGYQRVLGSPDVASPFAVEVTSSNLYWSRVSGSGSILRSDLNGANIVTIIPSAYVYDFQVTSNYIYYCDNNYPSAIKRANLNGTGITNLVTDTFGIGIINGICVTSNALYWSAFNDDFGGGIRRATLTGGGRTNLYNAPSGTSVRGIVVLEVATATVVSPPPVFTNAAAGSGGFAFTLLVQPGNPYRIYTSGNLTNWTEITNFVSTGTAATFTNAIPPGATNLYFRARTP